MPTPFQESTGETKTAVAGLLIVAFLVGRHFNRKDNARSASRRAADAHTKASKGTRDVALAKTQRVVEKFADQMEEGLADFERYDGTNWGCGIFADRMNEITNAQGRAEGASLAHGDVERTLGRQTSELDRLWRERRFTARVERMQRTFRRKCTGFQE